MSVYIEVDVGAELKAEETRKRHVMWLLGSRGDEELSSDDKWMVSTVKTTL